MDFNNSPRYYNDQSLATQASSVMKNVYLKMCMALVVSAFVALYCSTNQAYLNFIFSTRWAMWGMLLAELGLVLWINAGLNRLSSGTASVLFYVFAALNGATLAPIFLAYTMTSIVKTFFICAATFGAMTIYGYFTSNDLTKWGTYLTYALIGLIIVVAVNLIFPSTQNPTLDWIISGAGVLIFIGLTAWDTQWIKNILQNTPDEYHAKLSTIGALSLYLDFINLFLYLLRFFGGRSND